MNASPIAVSPNKLEISNPFRLHGVLSLILGCALCFIVWKSPALTIAEALIDEFKDVERLIDVAEENPEQLLPLLAPVITCVFLLIAIYYGITAIFRGLARTFSFFTPTGIPGQIENSMSVLGSLLSNRTIHVYEKPSASMQFLAATISGRFAYVRGRCRKLLEETMSSIPKWLFFLGLLTAPRFHPDYEDWPLPIALAALAAFAIGVRFVALLSSIPRAPDANVHELRSHVATTGNPNSFFSHLRNSIHQFRYREFPNRMIRETIPKLGRVAKGESGEFSGTLLVETQPAPLSRGIALNAVILELGAWTILCVTLSTMLFAEDFPPPVIPYLITVVTALLGIRVAASLMSIGSQLHEVFHFESEIFEVAMNGTYTASGIGIGDGRGGQLYSQRVSMQSETFISVRGCTLRTECEPQNGTSALEAPRQVVSGTCPLAFTERCEQLLKTLENFEDAGGQLADIDVSAPSVQKIAAANLQIRDAKLENLPAPALPLALPVGSPTAKPAIEVQEKTCPDCGESIKAIARKCRFCGFRFDNKTEDTDGTNSESNV